MDLESSGRRLFPSNEVTQATHFRRALPARVGLIPVLLFTNRPHAHHRAYALGLTALAALFAYLRVIGAW